jgi:hypothetical protein
MKTINLGHETTITPQWVKTHTTMGWVARILGTDEKYVLKRRFLDRETPDNRHLPRGWNWWRVPGSGLYEYRNLGDGTLSGFVVVEGGAIRGKARLVDGEQAFAMAKRGK